jgi:parallel beta-helix repeat protein
MTFMHTRVAIAALTLAGALAGAGPAAAKSPPSTVKCGDTLTRSVKLTTDLTDCPGDGLVIGAAGITVDLNGHTIDGTATQLAGCDGPPSGPIGVSDGGGYDGLTIKNGTIQQFGGGFNAGSETEGMADSTLFDLTVRDNRFDGIVLGSAQRLNNDNRIMANRVYGNVCGNGIVLNNASDNLVARNRSHDNDGGITICCSDRNVVRDNVVAHNADSGITVCCDSLDTLVKDNEVLDNASNGIIVLFGAKRTLVRENHVARNGNDIAVFEASGNTVSRNRATDALVCSACFGPTGYGIGITGGSDDNVVSDNLVSRTERDGIGILDFDPADPDNPVSDRTAVRGNVVRQAGGDGVHVDAGMEGTVLERNHAFGAGDDGIQVDSAATVLTGNAAFFNHDLGIEAVPGVTDGGRNRAHGNGNPAQCTGVACS